MNGKAITEPCCEEAKQNTMGYDESYGWIDLLY
jgi:hypothetical protein